MDSSSCWRMFLSKDRQNTDNNLNSPPSKSPTSGFDMVVNMKNDKTCHLSWRPSHASCLANLCTWVYMCVCKLRVMNQNSLFWIFLCRESRGKYCLKKNFFFLVTTLYGGGYTYSTHIVQYVFLAQHTYFIP